MNFKSLRQAVAALLVVATFVLSTAFIAAPAMAATYEVDMGTTKGLKFEPSTLTVAPGDTVKWINNKLGPHNIVFEGSLKGLSETKLIMKPGATVETVIPEGTPAGKYSFYCTPHRGAGMVGTLTVE